MALCLATAATSIKLLVAAFTLVWTHSIEKIDWQEQWQVQPDGLLLVAATVRGSGAGMEVPDGAVWQNGAWTYSPQLRVPVLRLTRSPYVPDYRLCLPGQPCQPLWHWLPADDTVTTVAPCKD
ncbi:DUF1850 domain-containing protein [Vogesella mureinivorans]|jgi:hypothetical protein|uniref:DUF1850 domain-containing protein n=1 Tax=Vogesella mureinivorans TaxID=657276 RepID=UPI0011CCC9AE|nr:DUF1850 domain-containing protein [Vogesella mureinivorans]